MVTLKDISKHTGLSLTQVSRAINNHNDVSEASKKKVMEAVKELGYVPNLAAKKLATKVDNSIALIIVGFEKHNISANDMFIEIMSGVFNFATENEYEVVQYLYSEKLRNKKRYLQFCKERNVSGAILCGVKRNDPSVKELIKLDFPTVFIDIPYLTESVGSVVIDNEKYAYIATKTLIENGRKNIGFINGHEKAHVSIGRKSGYTKALKESGLTIDESKIKNGEYELEKAKQCAIELINENVDAIFCASDIMALGVLNACKDLNKCVPNDVSIFGFDGITLLDYITPSISTIKQDSYDKGYKACKLLINYLKKEEPMDIVESECSVLIREST
ncbi:TPA: LacI family DNA-binding transcriptional regulator [Clostridioides difficile]|nr:LacI family DNA-binding transcriptional regulator [Clostridioides difficile]